MDLSIETDETELPLSPPEKFSPLKLEGADVTRVEIVSASKQAKANKSKNASASAIKAERGREKEKEEDNATRRELQAQQGRVYDLLLQTAAASMFEDEVDAKRGDELAPSAAAIAESPPERNDEPGSLRAVCISPALLSVPQPGTQRFSHDMASMFASLDSPEQRHVPFTPALATPFYGSGGAGTSRGEEDDQVMLGDGQQGLLGLRESEGEGEESTSPSSFTYGYQLDVDAMLRRDLDTYEPSPASSEPLSEHGRATCFTPPLSDPRTSAGSSPRPTPRTSPSQFSPPLIAMPRPPEPPQPPPPHAPYYARSDTSKAVLVDQDRDSSAALIDAFAAFLERLPLPAGALPEPDEVAVAGEAEADLAAILAAHRCLVDARIVPA